LVYNGHNCKIVENNHLASFLSLFADARFLRHVKSVSRIGGLRHFTRLSVGQPSVTNTLEWLQQARIRSHNPAQPRSNEPTSKPGMYSCGCSLSNSRAESRCARICLCRLCMQFALADPKVSTWGTESGMNWRLCPAEHLQLSLEGESKFVPGWCAS
jgi:hypothetical protein